MEARGYGDEVEILGGGVANAGQVLRNGDTVHRPLPANAATLHALLRHLRATSAAIEAPLPVGIDGDVEIVEFVHGDVALAPFPAWANTDRALVTVAGLLRRLHDATASWTPPEDASWSAALADPEGGPIICHNDVCMENVVFRDGGATALIDFDFAAPGRRVWDVVMAARFWVPLTDPGMAAAADRGINDPVARLRTFVDAYGLDEEDRRIAVEVLYQTEEKARRYVEGQAARGVPSFVAMWDDARVRFDRKLAWIDRNATVITEALVRRSVDGR
jgi:hypothetical protein